jgi:gamma-glutamyltranspeptidase/glutathione hydrolase
VALPGTGGAIAAGHPVTAEVGAEILRADGNATDAAIAAVLASIVCEPLLTGLGAGGYLLHAAPGEPAVLLDFFVAAPGRESPQTRAELLPVEVSFGDALQVFNIGPASVGTPGMPAGLAEAARRFASRSLAELAAPAVTLAREGVTLVPQQAYLVEILGGIVLSSEESRALFAPAGRLLRAGELMRQPELADALERLGEEGAEPFYRGDIARAVAEWVGERGGLLGTADLAAYRAVARQPVRVSYRSHDVLTNPPPSAGGLLIARALAELERRGEPLVPAVIEAMELAQRARTPEFLAGLGTPGFGERFLSGGRLGSTTHISVLDRHGGACSVTCSNGASSGVVVPGTGIHLNNMLGEQDLNPLGFHRHPPGQRLPSMMAPTIVSRGGRPRLVLGSAGSNRIRSAILQTIIRVLDDGLHADAAVAAPRLHYEDGIVYAEPGVDVAGIQAEGRTVVRFRERNLFFGGTQAVEMDGEGRVWGGGDPRRGGAAVVV